MEKIADLMDQAMTHKDNTQELSRVREAVERLTQEFPIYKDLCN